MSSNGNGTSNAHATASPALNVGFSSIDGRHGESRSKAESSRSSRRSSGKRSSGSPKVEERAPLQEAPNQVDSGDDTPSPPAHRTRRSGGFLLDSVFANGSPPGPNNTGKRKAQDGQLRVDKRRLAQGRLSAESSLRGSPLSREVSVDGPADERNDQATSRPPSMDASQLVQMALNLSESRKRNVSNSLRVPSGADRRVTSMQMSNIGTVRAASSARQRSSLRSDDVSRDSPSSNQPGDEDVDESSDALPIFATPPDNVFYTFTPATLARAEKARKYFELASEHRRLLQSLPPLKPDALTQLGRSYNPIQALRNRRIRIRERRPFPAPLDSWADPERVQRWVNDVESETTASDSYYADGVKLPPFEHNDDYPTSPSKQQQTAPRHRRTDTVGSVITRPENSWTIEPTELLADAYWTETGDNKAWIENRKGNPIFPSHHRQSVSTPKISVELVRDKGEDVDEVDFADDVEENGQRSRRRRLLLPLTGNERKKHRRLISRASSSDSGSSNERPVPRTLLRSRSDENIGPLERHMQELIAKDEKGELSSPEMSSPDHWNARFMALSAQRTGGNRTRGDSSGTRPRTSLDIPFAVQKRSQSADGRVGSIDSNISYTDDDIGSEPASPTVTRDIPSISMDLSPDRETRSFDETRGKGPRLPTFRSQSKERNKIGQTDFADIASNALSPILSAGSQPPTSPQYGQRPDGFSRQRTNDSWTGLRRLDTGSTMRTMDSSNQGSSVGRFLRNRRDRIFRNRERIDGGASDLSAGVSENEEESPEVNGRIWKLAGDESDASPRGSFERERPKPKYHLSGLPTFSSSSRDRRIQIETPGSRASDPLDRQGKKSDRLVPPHIKLPDADKSNEDLATGSTESVPQTKKGYGHLNWEWPKSTLAPGIFTPGISQAKRHWSIYDIAQPYQDDKVSSRDIARARALLLSSGIKAREIQRRADQPRDTPSAVLIKAATTTRQPLEIVPMKEEHLVASRMLTGYLSTALTDFEGILSNFQSGTARDLSTKLESLRQKAADHLTNLVHNTSDEADAFIIELNTGKPQQIRRVDDAIDNMLSRRRRQFRHLRIAGFKLLEWLVLGILWWIWFLVVVFNTSRKVVVAIYRMVRWLFVL